MTLERRIKTIAVQLRYSIFPRQAELTGERLSKESPNEVGHQYLNILTAAAQMESLSPPLRSCFTGYEHSGFVYLQSHSTATLVY